MQDMVAYQTRRTPGKPPLDYRKPSALPRSALRKPVRTALFDRALERRASVHPRQPGRQIWIRPQLPEYLGHFADKAHLDVGARERGADEELAALERAIDIAEVIGKLAIDARMQRRPRLLQPADIEIEQQRQHRRAFRI